VHLVADVELGGTDQLFNLMVGRDLMREWGLRPQIVMTTPLLEGLSADADAGGKIVGDKMSKSLDNYVGVSEPAEEQLGKLMSISDPLMWRYYELLSKESRAEIDARRAGHPKEAKRLLAMEIVTRFHDAAAAERVWAAWEKQFSRREIPDAIPEHTLATAGEGIGLAQALAQSGLSESNSKARALIEQGGVEVDSHKVKDKLHKLAPGTYVIKAGKRSWGRLVVT
jgi:tyrosyl-tRNA synthetase